MKDYRAIYKRHFCIDFGKDFSVHHIDFDRNNNDIDNLLLLPRGLHTKYHSCLLGCENNQHKISGIIGDLSGHRLTSLKNLAVALTEIEKWVKWKLYKYDEYIGSLIFDGTEEFPLVVEVKE